ncbi:MAG: hypothetical protein JWO49_977 [Arthrobacter sp.]|nr:hypothetical protein [Arthrobacter sp.]
MTQPAAHGPLQQHAEDPGQSGLSGNRNGLPADAASGPAGVGQAAPASPGRRDRGRPWRQAAAIAAAGVPVGVLWWLLAPSGLNLLMRDPALASGSNIAGWLPRDLVLAGLFLLAGCVAGVLVSGSKHAEPAPRTIILAVLAAALGAVLAWGTGVLSGQWWGAPTEAAANASIAFSLRSYPVLAIWPAALALAVFLDSAFRTSGGLSGSDV